MWRRALLIATVLSIVGCVRTMPGHYEFLEVSSREELLEMFGEPDAISKFTHSPDVISPAGGGRTGVRTAYYERWIYPTENRIDTTDADKTKFTGKTIVTLRRSFWGPEYFIESVNWLSDIEFTGIFGGSSNLNSH